MNGKWSWIRDQLTALSDMPSGGTRSVMNRGGGRRLTAIEGLLLDADGTPGQRVLEQRMLQNTKLTTRD